MKLITRCVLATAALAIAVSSASAALRVPQVAFNGAPLQAYLNLVDPGINVATQQVDAQVWATGFTGNTDFTLTLKTGLGNAASFGVYNGGAPAPLFQVFPPASVPGWYAALHFGGGTLTVTLLNQFNAILGQTVYPGVSQTNFGFYIQGPGGTWYSQDGLNAPPAPQMLTYGSAFLPGDYWLCFNATPYNPAATFDGVVVNVQSVRPTPAATTSWGRLKSLYR